MKSRIAIVSIILLASLFTFHSRSSAATGYGLPCAGGGPDYRDKMVGKFPGRIPRLDDVAGGGGEEIRAYVGFDAIYLAQCINPASSNAVQNLLAGLLNDASTGVITQCDEFALDTAGNIQLCDNDADSYITVTNGNWSWDYYENGDGGGTDPGDNTPPGTGSGSDPSTGVIPPAESSEVTVLGGYNGQLAYSPLSKLWLVTSQLPTSIVGVMVNEKNKPVGAQFTVASGMKQPFTPRVAYDSLDQKFLVVWVDNASQSIFYGQFLSPTGAILGSPFVIAKGKDLKIPENSHLLFDSRNKVFVFVYEINGGHQITLQTVKTDGTPEAPVLIRNPQNGQVMMSDVAFNANNNEYCVAYRWSGTSTRSSIAVQPVDATTHTAGSEYFVSDNAFFFSGIAYDSVDDHYLVVWQDGDLANLNAQILPQCASVEDDPLPIAGKDNAASVTYNSGSNTFAVITQDQETFKNNVYVMEASSLQSVQNYSLFGGGSGNFQPFIAPNATTGTFAAVSSQGRTQTKFVANIGWPDVTALVGQHAATVSNSQNSTIPSEGLPTDLGQFIGAIFLWSFRIIGFVIFIRFFWAGLLWFTSAGNSAKVKQAQEIMKNAALGAVVLFAAYLILNSINPDLVKGSLNLPGIQQEKTATK